MTLPDFFFSTVKKIYNLNVTCEDIDFFQLLLSCYSSLGQLRKWKALVLGYVVKTLTFLDHLCLNSFITQLRYGIQPLTDISDTEHGRKS